MSDEANEDEVITTPGWVVRVRYGFRRRVVRVRYAFWSRCPYPLAAWLTVRPLVFVLVTIGVTFGVLGALNPGAHIDPVQNVFTGLLAILCTLIAANAVYQRQTGHTFTIVRGAGKDGGGLVRIQCQVQSLTMSEPVAYASCARCGVLDVQPVPTPVEPVVPSSPDAE